MSRPRIYLAGAMEKAGKYGTIWRENITPHLEYLGYDVWNPYNEEVNVGINVEELTDLKHKDFDTYRKFCQNIVTYDIDQLKKCSAVACVLDWAVQMGAGTYGELTICRANNIPVYALIKRYNGEYDIPSWAMGCITEFTTNEDEFYSIIPPASVFIG